MVNVGFFDVFWLTNCQKNSESHIHVLGALRVSRLTNHCPAQAKTDILAAVQRGEWPKTLQCSRPPSLSLQASQLMVASKLGRAPIFNLFASALCDIQTCAP